MAGGARSSSLFLLASLAFFALSFIGMGLAPWTSLRNVLRTPGENPYRDGEQAPQLRLGRAVYIREGCWHCHSQFVRPVANEESRYGPVSEASESQFDVPQLFGTRRIGPDLAREAGRRPDDWHFAHLWNPRSVVPQSIMPDYPWLFRKSADPVAAPEPTAEGTALVAYLQQVGHLKAEDIQTLMYPQIRRVDGAPVATPELGRHGAMLFERHCIGCHGANADGRGPARAFLNPPAENLTAIQMLPEEAYRILACGVRGSSMPSWRELSQRDLWALAQHVVTRFQGDTGVRALEGVPPAPAPTGERLARGRAAFAENCVTCHGVAGRGDGDVAAALMPAPPDFERYRPDTRYAFQVITNGYGTTMPPWSQLPEAMRWDLAVFVHSLWKGDASDSSASALATATTESRSGTRR